MPDPTPTALTPDAPASELDRDIEALDLFHLGSRSGDPGAERLDQEGNALDVVSMVMGDEDVGQPPAARLECGEDGAGVGRIDGRRAAGFRVVREVAVVVLAAHEGVDNETHALKLLTTRHLAYHRGAKTG